MGDCRIVSPKSIHLDWKCFRVQELERDGEANEADVGGRVAAGERIALERFSCLVMED